MNWNVILVGIVSGGECRPLTSSLTKIDWSFISESRIKEWWTKAQIDLAKDINKIMIIILDEADDYNW